ncbi:YdcF family protein [Levilactobacillus suantsaiihabitans]|uniref:YdcF family protein n=1 Tax=Levilactobacillus suantsaiihabitans TaxID=2487722 RepID=A0A4Z0JBM0_9LACO|nr:YdcF family protein [Levilactobacillus suantsaiihabitans]TGD20205.1 YdcF family protein [Levilactobacillus suantsaiihabitans]
MLFSASLFLICLAALLTFWQPHGLSSAVVTCISGGIIILLAGFSHHAGWQVVAHVGWVLIGLVAALGLFILLLILNVPRLVVRKNEHLTYGVLAGIWLWLILGIGWLYNISHGNFSGTLWPWVTFIPVFSVYIGILFAASLVGFLRANLWRARKADTIVILGAGLLHGDQIGRVLGSRLDTALALARRQKGPVTLLVTGGQGPDETTTEAAAMADYLIAHDWPQDQIVQETQATNTFSNLLYSQRLWGQLPHQGGRVVIVTNNYHLFRAEHLASQLGIRFGGYPAPTRLGYLPTAWAREFLAIIMLHPRLHRGVLVGLIATNILWFLI